MPKLMKPLLAGRKKELWGEKNAKKKLVVFAIERNGKGVSRMYGKVIKKSSSKELGEFVKTTIGLNAQIKTDK